MMFLVLFVAISASAQATFDCQKRNFTAQEANSCCYTQVPKWDALPIECTKYMLRLHKPVSPCAYECVVNVTRILQNGKFEIANIRPLLRKVYTDENAQQAYIKGFEKCTTIFNKKISEQRAQIKSSSEYSRSRKYSSSQQCSHIPLKFVMCANREVFINCPAVNWINSSTCEHIREYSKNCDTTLSLKRRTNRSYGNGNRTV